MGKCVPHLLKPGIVLGEMLIGETGIGPPGVQCLLSGKNTVAMGVMNNL